jgi:tRNA(Ile)-lysidine synthase
MIMIAEILRCCPIGPSYLVGVSGGADSMAMLHLLWEAGHRKLVVCHLHHGLRGFDADEDLRFVENTAAAMKLRFRSERADVNALAERDGLSIESAARVARHEFYLRCAGIHRCPRIILAHHADDQAETALWTLLRGSHGIRAMQQCQELKNESRSLTLLRPLLDVRRNDLRDYLTERALPWREDHTNGQLFCARNRMRHEVLPLLNDIMQRDVTVPLLRQCESSAEVRACEEWIVQQAAAFDPQGRIHLPAMRKLPVAIQMLVLRNFLTSQGVSDLSRSHLEQALGLIDADGAHVMNLPGGYRLRRRQGRMIVEPRR